MFNADIANLSALTTAKKGVDVQQRLSYYLTIWPYIREKWYKLGALEAAFEKDRPLGKWRHMVQELYEIKLKL